MVSRKCKQAGFSIVWAIVVVAAILIIGASGWFVYQHGKTKVSNTLSNTNQHSNSSSSPSDNSSPGNSQSPPTNQSTNTFTIPELYAKMTLPDGLTPTDLKYAISTDTGVPVANFTTTSLEQADGTDSCRAAQAPIGIIWRTTQNPASGSVTVKQIGSYYYAFEKPQGSCTGNINAGKLEQSQTALLQQAFQTITSIN